MKMLLCFILMGATAAVVAQDGGSDRRSRSNWNRDRSGATRTETATSGAAGENQPEYVVISERNIFLRDRPRPRGNSGPTTRRADDRTPLTPEQSFALRGVVFEEDQYLAYFENIPEASVQQVSIGGELAGQRIVDIDMDAVELEKDGNTFWIEVGQDLTGNRAQSARPSGGFARTGSSSPAPTASNAPGSAAPPALPSEGETEGMSIEERMRLRAQQLRGGR